MQVRGFCFDGQSSRRHPALLVLNAQGQLCLHFAGRELCHAPDRVQISPRLGNTPRQLAFDDGATFATSEHDALALLLRHLATSTQHKTKSDWLHQLESRWRWILGACLVLLLALYLGLTQGAPLAARIIVTFIPDAVEQHIGTQSMQMLDQILLEPSKLPVQRQQELQRHFAPLLQAHPELSLRVHFRHAPSIGANAFALPGGDMVFTDQIVQLSESDDELGAVLAHEIGHVYHHHGMRRVVQNGLLYWGLFAITGDISAASETIAAAPALLMNMAYSRQMEDEADDFALQQLLAHGIAPRHFAHIMRRLESTDARPDTSKNRLLRLLSSHPDTHARIRKFEP